MDLYKELRVETKGLSAIEDEGPGVRPSSLDKVDGDGDENDPSKGNSPIPTSDVKISNASGLTSPHKSPEAVLPTDADKETDKRGSAPDAGDSSEAVEAPQDAEPDPEGDEAKAATAEQSIPEEVGGDRVPLSAAADVLAGEGERNNGQENESGEKAEEEEEGCGGGVVVMDASGEEVYGPLIPESRESESESVISRIHQSTH